MKGDDGKIRKKREKVGRDDLILLPYHNIKHKPFFFFCFCYLAPAFCYLAPAWEQEEQGELERRNRVSTSKPGF